MQREKNNLSHEKTCNNLILESVLGRCREQEALSRIVKGKKWNGHFGKEIFPLQGCDWRKMEKKEKIINL